MIIIIPILLEYENSERCDGRFCSKLKSGITTGNTSFELSWERTSPLICSSLGDLGDKRNSTLSGLRNNRTQEQGVAYYIPHLLHLFNVKRPSSSKFFLTHSVGNNIESICSDSTSTITFTIIKLIEWNSFSHLSC